MNLPPARSWDYADAHAAPYSTPELRRQESNVSAPVESVVIYPTRTHEELSDQEDDVLMEEEEERERERVREESLSVQADKQEEMEDHGAGDAMAIMAAVAMAQLSGKKTPVGVESPATSPRKMAHISPSSVFATAEIRVHDESGGPKRKMESESRLPFKKRRSSVAEEESKDAKSEEKPSMESRNPSPIMPQRGEEADSTAKAPRRVSPTPNSSSYYEHHPEQHPYARQGSPSHHHYHHHEHTPYQAPHPHGYPHYHERSYSGHRSRAPPPHHYYGRAPSSAPRYPHHYGAPSPHHYHHPGTRSPQETSRVPISPPKMYERGQSAASSPMVPLYEELVRTSGLPKSLSFRKICSRCGKTRGEHGELGFGNKCVFQECGKCMAGLHVHKKAGQPMGILCQLTVDEGATAGAASAYERKIKDLAVRADLQKEMRRRQDGDSMAADDGREAPTTA